MKAFIRTLIVALLLVSFQMATPDPSAAIEVIELQLEDGSYRCVADELLVRPVPGLGMNNVLGIFSLYGASIRDAENISKYGYAVAVFPTGTNLIEAKQLLCEDPFIESAHLNYVGTFETNDPLYPLQWALANVEAEEGWNAYTRGDPSVVVAILDSGYSRHVELDKYMTDRIIIGTNFTTETDFEDLKNHAMPMAGIISAETDNSNGIAGASWYTKLMFVKIGTRGDEGEGLVTVEWLANGIHSVVDSAIANPDLHYIINASVGLYGSRGDLQELEYAVSRADQYGVLIVAAAGNYEGDPKNEYMVKFPARYSRWSTETHYCNVICVGAVKRDYEWASYSNYRGEDECEVYIDISAPGGASQSGHRIITLDTDNPGFLSLQYDSIFGTSCATAYVSGAAALAWSLNPYLSHYEVKRALKSSTFDPSDPLMGTYFFGPAWCYEPITPEQYFAPMCDDDSYQFRYNQEKGTGVLNIHRTLNTVKRPCIHGVWNKDITFSDTVTVVGDLIIADGSTLTIEEGSVIRISSSDCDHGGEDESKVEIVIEGTLIAEGSQMNAIVFEPNRGNAQPGYWSGIRFTGSNTNAVLRYCTISCAYHAIKSYKPATIAHCSIIDSEVHGVVLQGSSANGAIIGHCSCSGNGAAGIMISDCDSVSIDTCTVSGNYYGLWFSNADHIFIDKAQIECNTAGGVMLDNSRYCTFERCVVEENGQHGIHFINASGSVNDSKIWKNSAYGIYCCGASTDPIIGFSKIEQNLVGIKVASGAEPCLGLLLMGGSNAIYNQPWYVYASPDNTIYAENNWWGTGPGEPPNPAKFKGIVDFTPYLQSDPVAYLYRRNGDDSGIMQLMQNFPNPFSGNGSTTISYFIPAENEHVTFRVYDVTGRRVRTIVDGVQSKGRHSVFWDGRNDKGRRVASGIYIYELRTGAKCITKKCVLFR